MMFELAVDILDPNVSRFQLYLSIFIALVAIFIVILKTYLAERDSREMKRVLAEMREYKEVIRKEEAQKRQDDMKKWEEGDNWPIGAKDEGPEDDEGSDEEGPRAKDRDGGEGDGEG